MKKLFCIGILFLLVFSVLARDYHSVSGDKISSKDLNSEEKAVLLFWTTWCPYCAIQVKTFNAYCEELIGEGFKIFFVNVQESESRVKAFKAKMGLKCPVILDKDGDLAYEYRISGIPTYIFLKEGKEIDRTNFINKKQLERLYKE